MEGMGGMLGGGGGEGGGLSSAAGVLLSPLVYCSLRWCTARSAGVLLTPLVYNSLRWCTARSAGVQLAPLVYCLLRWCTACSAGALACSVGVLLASLVYCLLHWCTACSAGVLPTPPTLPMYCLLHRCTAYPYPHRALCQPHTPPTQPIPPLLIWINLPRPPLPHFKLHLTSNEVRLLRVKPVVHPRLQPRQGRVYYCGPATADT